MDTYNTISTSTEGIYKEKGSKFLSFAIHVNTSDEVKEWIKKFKKEYYDARHVCYAYMLGADRKEWRANDDGEPSGTAGRPIMGQINSRGFVVYLKRFNYDQGREASILSGTNLIPLYNQLGQQNLLNYTQNSHGVSVSASYPD